MGEDQRTVAVVGAGTIGLSWASLFAAHGMSVRVTDPRPDVAGQVEAAVQEAAQGVGAGDGRVALGVELDGHAGDSFVGAIWVGSREGIRWDDHADGDLESTLT